jgi:hypothetical protein
VAIPVGKAGENGRGARVRKRFAAVLFLVAVTTGLIMPATAAAGSVYSFRVVANFCDGAQPNISVKLIKPAGASATGFTIFARAQHSATGSADWSKEGTMRPFRKDVPQQSEKYKWTRAIHYVAPDNKWHRIKVQLFVVDQDAIVASDTTYSTAC